MVSWLVCYDLVLLVVLWIGLLFGGLRWLFVGVYLVCYCLTLGLSDCLVVVYV